MRIQPAVVVGATAAATLAAHTAGFYLLGRSAKKPLRQSVVRNARGPARLIIPLTGAEVALSTVRMEGHLRSVLLHAVGIALILALAFLVVRLTYIFDDLVLARYQIDSADNLKARQVHTQIQVLRRVTVVVVAVVAVAFVLLSFSAVRAAGAGLLASAGVVGIVAGVAIQPTATNLMAGLQIAVSQPIRIDDVVVVEGHWGRVEQIALTYVVVRVWDLRRLVLPISYFIKNPFENWTRSSAEILGWVFLDVDYSAPVDAIRQRLRQVLASSSNWDGKVWALQVTDLGPHTMQLRALMSSPDSSSSWDLQCEVREKLVAFLKEEHPGVLPRQRTELVWPSPGQQPRPE